MIRHPSVNRALTRLTRSAAQAELPAVSRSDLDLLLRYVGALEARLGEVAATVASLGRLTEPVQPLERAVAT